MGQIDLSRKKSNVDFGIEIASRTDFKAHQTDAIPARQFMLDIN